jgi:hypothetical protein
LKKDVNGRYRLAQNLSKKAILESRFSVHLLPI